MSLSSKPLSSTQARDPHSLRFCAGEWEAIVAGAQIRGLEPAAFARECCLMGLMIVNSRVLMESHLKTLSVIRAASNGHGKP